MASDHFEVLLYQAETRADVAEAKLAAITAHCRKHALHAQLHCPDLGRPAEALVKADAILAIIDGGHAVTAAALRSYLASTGWHEKSSGPAGTLWTLGIRTDGVGVPHDDSDPDAVQAAVVRVAKREHRAVAEVTAGILAAEGGAGNDQ